MVLGSGKLVVDFSSFECDKSGQKIIVTNRDGTYIAAQSKKGNVLLWKVHGIDLPASCTLADRCVLHELDEMYRIGQGNGANRRALYELGETYRITQGRNEKYYKNYVIRLNVRQWKKFQELLHRPECEVPHDWQRLFRLIKPA